MQQSFSDVQTASNEVGLTTCRLQLETRQEPIVLLHAECPVARSEGFAARAQIELRQPPIES
jgi:hypothetical protein